MSSDFLIAIEAFQAGVGDLFFIDDLRVVIQNAPSPIVENADIKGPGALLVDGSAVLGGEYTIEFFNNAGTELVSGPFSTTGAEGATWVYAQAHRDYLVVTTAGDNTITAYIRQIPGPTNPVTGQRVFIESWKPFGNEVSTVVDDDGDGIENLVDGQFVGESFVDETQAFSASFTDQHLGGTSYGVIDDRADLDITP